MSKPNYEMHEFLLSALGEKARVLELGSGEGTHNLVKLFKKIYVVEHSKLWAERAPEEAEVIYAPLYPYASPYYRDATYWYDPTVLQEKLPKASEYDAIIVDGPKGSHGRGGFDTYFNLFNQDAVIVFDDVHRLWEFRLAGRVAQRLNKDLIVKTGTEGRRWFGVIC